MPDLGDHEVLERLSVFVGSRLKRDVESPFQGPLDARIEVVELRTGALLLPHGAVECGQEKAHQGVFQNREVGDDGLRIGSHVPCNVV